MFSETPSRTLKGRYLIKTTLSRGRVSTVYHAVDAATGVIDYAIKELSTIALFRADERRSAEEQFHRAVARWSACECPGVVDIVETFASGDKHYVVSEYVRGLSTRQIVAEASMRVGPLLARNWGSQLAQILAALHQQEPPFYQPWLSPAQVMVDESGQVRLLCSGLSRLFEPNAVRAYGSVKGYTAPELADSYPSASTDVFALGRILYALLIDRDLERGLSQRLPLKRAVPGISDRLVKAVARAAQRSPEKRFGSAAEVINALWEGSDDELAPDPEWRSKITYSAETNSPGGGGSAAARPRRPSRVAVSRSEATSMADLGFEPDPRYGARPAPAAAQAPSQPATAPGLSVYPRHIKLHELAPDQTKRVPLTIRNTGDAALEGRVLSHVAWIKAPKRSMRIPSGKQARVILGIKPDLLPGGRTVEPEALSVETNAGQQWIAVTAEVPVGPTLIVDQQVIDLGQFADAGERQATVRVRNAGRQMLSGSVVSRVPWLEVKQPEFRCGPGSDKGIQVRLLPDKLPRGPQSRDDALIVDSDGGQARVQVKAWRQTAELDLGATHMDFGAVAAGERAERLIYIHNAGDGALEGSLRALVPWLEAFPHQFQCEADDMVQITVVADCTGLADGPLEIPQALQVQSNGGSRTLSLRASVQAPKLVVQTAQLDLGSVPLGQSRSCDLTIGNEGSMALTARFRSLAAWLTIAPEEVVCQPGAQVAVTATAATAAFDRGQEIMLPAAVRIVSGSTMLDLPASLIVLRPGMLVEPQVLDFGYVDPATPETRSVAITNDGTGPLAWNAQTDATWFEVDPAAGEVPPHETRSLTVRAYGLAIDPEERAGQGTLVLNSDAGRVKIAATVGLAAPLVAADTTFLDLGPSLNRAPVVGAVRLFNRGLGMLRGTIASDATWLIVDRASFECGTGQSVRIGLSVDMDEIAETSTGEEATLIVSSNGGELIVDVSLTFEATPQLSIPSSIILSPQQSGGLRGRLVIANDGLATGHVELRASDPGLVLSRSYCDIKPGKRVRLSMETASGVDVAGEQYVEIDDGQTQVRVPVTTEN